MIDSDAGRLTYLVANTNTQLLAATVDGSKLLLDQQPDQHGIAALPISVKDATRLTDSQTFNQTVSVVADVPLATDVDSQNLTYSLVSAPAKGKLSAIADGKLTLLRRPTFTVATASTSEPVTANCRVKPQPSSSR
ncbi:MAG: hypothetical protein QGI86_21700 [Candidatus Poribacteria bacterium]|nr:hypothetical protein [Candidatus Poribacteria bacterium]MDP6749288.1 hypothetical protein [Candidatus Poribacteria bacterium]MDP6962212.1 hypothetical protein [Dehalococcoidia bacterium]